MPAWPLHEPLHAALQVRHPTMEAMGQAAMGTATAPLPSPTATVGTHDTAKLAIDKLCFQRQSRWSGSVTDVFTLPAWPLPEPMHGAPQGRRPATAVTAQAATGMATAPLPARRRTPMARTHAPMSLHAHRISCLASDVSPFLNQESEVEVAVSELREHAAHAGSPPAYGGYGPSGYGSSPSPRPEPFNRFHGDHSHFLRVPVTYTAGDISSPLSNQLSVYCWAASTLHLLQPARHAALACAAA